MSDYVRKYLDISTAHMPNPEALDAPVTDEVAPDWPHRVEPHEYGWLVWICADDDPVYPSSPAWFKPIEALARKEDCILVQFDQDADLHPDLPTYDW